ncbi:leucine-rich repeat-containing protein 46 isoform X2 [Rhineura floridana]|uniref:leucine-rich repeat-containing protein 46 isoform X2 n=1 Tax=Rhineura floridana TaxID=261503 RepID=UPI002AC7F76C|nr:leucine-rich repeat-containing protein 46 isoform X2 [Rhineura floridana]
MPEENSQRSSKGGVSLTKSLIAQRNLSIPVENEALESISQALTSLQILRLDRERINCITNLEGLEQIHSIYLQQNQIEKIENLSCFPNLKFLSLAGNCIRRVNLQALLKLQFLDLSHNCIETLDTDELPQSLVVLDLTGNKCTKQNGYRERVLAALPHLKELDTQGVPSWKAPVQNREEEEEEGSEDSDYDGWPELSTPLSTEKDFFMDLHNEFSGRSAQRRKEEVKEHEDRLEELKLRQDLRQLVFSTSQGRPQPLNISGPTTPSLEDSRFQSEHHPAPNPLANPTLHTGIRAPKGKAGGSSQTQSKISKGEVSGTAKTASKSK